MEGNDSETTDDSPFTSALMTPVDQDVSIDVYQGIHKALTKDTDGSAVDSYLDLKAVGKGPDIVRVSQKLEEQRVFEVEVRFILLQNLEAFHSHPLDITRRNVGTSGPGETTLSPQTSLSLVLKDTTSDTPSLSPLYQEPAAVVGDSNEDDFVSQGDDVEPLALDLEGSITVPEPSEVSQVPGLHFSPHGSV